MQAVQSPLMLASAYFDVLSPFMAVFFVAFCFAFALTPVARRLAIRFDVVDHPNERKRHGQPIAYLGGVAIFGGWIAGIATAYLLAPGEGGSLLAEVGGFAFPIPIIFGAAVITTVGVIDDVYHVTPRIKVGGQLLAAAALAYGSTVGDRLVLDLFGAVGFAPPVGLVLLLSALILAIFVVGGCNSVNLIDGLDGLAAGTTGIATLGLLFISVFAAAVHLPQVDPLLVTDTVRMASAVRIVLCLATLGAVLGFLPYNFNPAVIFMGDAGSLLLGYLSAAAILQFALVPGKGPLMVMAGLIIFALPIADASLAVVRRKLTGKPVFSADNKHLHHRLLESGLSVRRAVLNLYAGAACLSILGAAIVMLRWRYVLAVFVVVFGFVAVTVYKTAQRIVAQPTTRPPETDA